MNRRALLIVLTIAVALVASACSSPSPKIAITTAPPASMEINTSASIAASVTHDSGDKGVDWSCAPAGSCGTFNPTHTDDGATTVYTAPATSGSVTITAASTKKSSVTATATVNVTAVASASSLSGQYAFSFSGFDASGDFYAAAGSVTLDGAGNVSAGEEDLNNTSFVAPVVGDLLTGTYTVGDDGQGTMTLNATVGGVADPLVGVGGTQTLALTVVNGNHALISEFDAAATSGGSLDLQSGAAITSGFVGNYAMTGAGFLGGNSWVFGGILNSTGTASTGTADQDLDGGVTTAIVTGGAVVAPDASGRGTFVLGSLTFAYYVIGTEAIRFTEIDTAGVTSGSAFGQGTTPAFSAASLNGPFVMDEPWPTGEGPDGVLGLAGQFSADGVGSIVGVVDYNQEGFVDPGPGPDSLTTSFAVPASGYGSITGGVVSNDSDFTTWGVYLVDPAVNIVDPNSSSGGGGAVIVELDAFALGAGFIIPQSATAGTSVNNGVDFTAFNSNEDLINSVGQVVDASGTVTGSASVNDLNISGTPSQTETSGVSLSGALTADATNAGRYTLPLTVGGAATPNTLVVYFASGGLAIIVDVDSTVSFAQVGSGTIQGQQ